MLYIEDDTYVSWEALQSWAADTEVLKLQNFALSPTPKLKSRRAALENGENSCDEIFV